MHFGDFLIVLSFGLALAASLVYVRTLATGARSRLGGVLFTAHAATLLAALALLATYFLQHRFEFEYVAHNSSRALSPALTFAALWAGQEGSVLLWAAIGAVTGVFLALQPGRLSAPAMTFAGVAQLFMTGLLMVRSPFHTISPVPADGVGLNPLLEDPWMVAHPPVLFVGYAAMLVPFALGAAAMVRGEYAEWNKRVWPWTLFAVVSLGTGIVLGGIWAYKVLGWGGYWGWDPVENGSLIPWLSNAALLHGLLVQRVTGSLRRTNFFLAITSYVLVLYASFLTRSGVLADFSVHSFANLGLSGFLLSFIGVAGIGGFGLLLWRLRDIPKAPEPLGSFSRESFMWLGQLVFMLMCALVAVGMSAPLITRLFGPPANVQTSYYNLVNGPLAIALGLLLGLGPLLRWRKQEVPQQAKSLGGVLRTTAGIIVAGVVVSFVLSYGNALAKAAFPWFGIALLGWLVTAILVYAPVTLVSVGIAVIFTALAVIWGVRDPMPAAIVFAMAFALAANWGVTVRGFRSGWRHGVAYLGHMGVAVLLIGVISSSGYGRSAQVQLPKGQARTALGYQLTYEGMKRGGDGKDAAVIAVTAPERRYVANAHFYWSDYNQSYMKNPHIERFLTHDVYIAPLDMVGGEKSKSGGEFFRAGETKKMGEVVYRFEGFTPIPGEKSMKLIANVTAQIGGRTVPLKPTFEIEMGSGEPTRTPDYLPGGGQVNIVNARPGEDGGVELSLPGMQEGALSTEVLAVEVSTKPFISLVWIGAIMALVATFSVMVRRTIDMAREKQPA